MLNEFKVYGYRGAMEKFARTGVASNGENGHNWLTEDPYL